MKASELIREIQEIIYHCGDCEVVMVCPEYCVADSVHFHPADEYISQDYITIHMEP